MSRVKVLKASDVRQRWSEVVNEVSREQTRVIVEKSGVRVVGVVGPRDLEWLQERDRRLAELRAVVDDLREVFQDVPLDEFDREVARALQDIRTSRNATPPA